MRPRIQYKVNVDEIINSINRREKVYSECIKDLMHSEGVTYQQARSMIRMRVINKIIFK